MSKNSVEHGVFLDMPNEVYHGELGHFSSSNIKDAINLTLRKMWWNKNNQRPQTPALRFGDICHKAILEPDTSNIVTLPNIGNTKLQLINYIESLIELGGLSPLIEGDLSKMKMDALRKVKDQMLDSLDAFTFVEEKEWHEINNIIDAVYAHPAASRLLRDAKKNGAYFEKSLFGCFNGLNVKVRPDIYDPSTKTIIDLKTTRNADPNAYQWISKKLGYFHSAWLYIKVLRQYGYHVDKFIHICVEKYEPYEVSVFELDMNSNYVKKILNNDMMSAINDINTCVANGNVFPGYSDSVELLCYPDDEDLDFESMGFTLE